MRYRALRPDEALRERLKALAHQLRRFGYRRLQVLLRRGAGLEGALHRAREVSGDFTFGRVVVSL